MILRCICCKKKLDTAIPKEVQDGNTPYGATIFAARGNYGSTVFDPFDGNEFLVVNICDECLKEANKEEDLILLGETSREVKTEYKKWEIS